MNKLQERTHYAIEMSSTLSQLTCFLVANARPNDKSRLFDETIHILCSAIDRARAALESIHNIADNSDRIDDIRLLGFDVRRELTIAHKAMDIMLLSDPDSHTLKLFDKLLSYWHRELQGLRDDFIQILGVTPATQDELIAIRCPPGTKC